MADLAHLRHMLLTADHRVFSLAGMCHHLLPDPTSFEFCDFDSVPRIRGWVCSAPLPVFGPSFPLVKNSFPDFVEQLQSLSSDAVDASVALLRAMRVEDKAFDKSTRNATTGLTAQSAPGASRFSAQSHIEFALYDCITEAGYASAKDAERQLQAFIVATKAKYFRVSRQFSRGRTAALFQFRPVEKGSRMVTLHVPYLTSAEATRIYLAVVLRQFIYGLGVLTVKKKAHTVLGYAARTSLTALRRITYPAHRIIEEYEFDRLRLAFLDSRGEVAYDVHDRSPSVVVAFARVLSLGSCDVNVEGSDLRLGIDVPGGPRGWARKYFEADTDLSGVVMGVGFALAEARVERDAHPGGQDLNKDEGLSYFARDRSARDRNTASCITRIEEVSCLMRYRQRDVTDATILIEWGGQLNHDLILAAAAMTGATVALDVGRASFQLGKGSAAPDLNDGDEATGSYICVVPHAEARGLHRIPVIQYPVSASINTRVERVAQSLGVRSSDDLIYICGGATAERIPGAEITQLSTSKMHLLLESTFKPGFFCSDILIPDLCAHKFVAAEESFVDPTVGGDCPSCQEFQYVLAVLEESLSVPGTSLVKPRASYAHNMHYSLEWDPSEDPEYAGVRTAMTLDATVAANVARNAEWATYVPGKGSRRARHREYSEEALKVIRSLYGSMVYNTEIGVGETRTVVDSIVNDKLD
ncbi:hypothetical protein [Fusarium redolens polymycovirus 1]|uniref:Uncharacterized protein n=1 Tax=Fusarium redolens polymycovirus 1 TaxID=2546034 RepID=A0A513ZVF1_9VIRU|nr:hypothetical protein KM555_s2gp1 [Fusarium redolens polymycovirus 1]QDH44657.1 hypothetical protein [Fusarium redolens polymycovirus 1]